MLQKFRGGKRMRVLKFFMLITVLSFSFLLNNVSAEESDFEELHGKYPNAVDILTEGSKEEAEELERKVLEDMKNNPDKVEFAVPLDDEQDGFASSRLVYLPYAYNFRYTSSLRGENFRSLSANKTISNQVRVTNSAYVTYSLYTKSGTFVASRIYMGNTISTAQIKIQPAKEYYFVLTGGQGWKEGNGYTWAPIY